MRRAHGGTVIGPAWTPGRGRREEPMLRAIDLNRAGMLRYQLVFDAHAQNLSNAATPGYKQSRAALETGEAGPADPSQTTAAGVAPLTMPLRLSPLFTQGPISATGTPTDLAIEGEGFFVVRQPDGSEGYTRNGGFQVNAQGQLTDPAGRAVLAGGAPVQLPPDAGQFVVASNGTITVVVQAVPPRSVELPRRLQLARFENPNGLLRGADGVYTATAASGAPVVGDAGANGLGTVRQGALEGANAELTEQMTSLLAAQRAYQLNATAFRTSDDMLRMAAQLSGTA
jgi:flagellar basal-body rod protein FlgG